MSEPILAEAMISARPERLHPLFVLTGFARSLRGLSGAYALIAYFVVSGQLATALVTALLIAGIGVGAMLLHWLRFEFRVSGSDIRIDSGIISRTHRSIPFDRVTDVDIKQGPLARVLGLAEVRFETGAAAGANDEEGVLRTIRLERAEAIRALIREHRGGRAPAAADPVAQERQRAPVYAMSLPRLLLAGLFNFSLALFAGLFGISQTAGDMLGFDPLSERFWRDLLEHSAPVQKVLALDRSAAVLAGLALLVIAGGLTGVVRTGLRDYGFRLDRTATGLRRRRGLLTLTDVTLPVQRIQAAIIGSGPIRDALGWTDLRLQSLARDDERQGDHVVAPLARANEIDAILTELGWRPLRPEPAWQSVSSAYFWQFVLFLTPLMLLLALELGALSGVLKAGADRWSRPEVTAALAPVLVPSVAALAALAVATLIRRLAWLRTGWALDRDRLLIRTGWWRRRLLILPLATIQSIDYCESFVSRWFGIASLRFGVAGGSGFSAHRIPALRRETARQLRDQLIEPMP